MIGQGPYDYNAQPYAHNFASRFNDPIANQINWEPMGTGGANFCTHKLVITGQNKAVFKPTTGVLIFNFLFLAIGLFLLIISVLSTFEFIPFILGLAFTLTGTYLVLSKSKSYVFDGESGFCHWGKKAPGSYDESAGKAVRIDNIHALQTLKRFVSGKQSYYTFEINLILHDGRRIPVISHGRLRIIRDDVQTLSRFLNRPVWDAIN